MLKNRLSGPWAAFILIILAVAIIYSNTFEYPFEFDDVAKIKGNVEIRDLTNYLFIDRMLKPRALVDFSFALNYRFGEQEVFGYHLTNVLIHIINGFLVYLLALTLFRHFFSSPQSSKPHQPESSTPFMALSAALIFVSHPIQTQAVTYTVQRYTSLATLFYLASVLFYLKARVGKEGNKRKSHSKVFVFFALSSICGMAAFLSKEISASLPGIILLMEYLVMDRSWQASLLLE